jgi:chorismate dehydratase
MRIGAVNYLNSKPLVHRLAELAPDVRLTFDLPSRLADGLAASRLDVALVPSIEFLRTPGAAIISDACVAACGPVLSVKLHFRVPPEKVRRVALDEGSRTSAALSRILLSELCGVRAQWEPLPIGCGLESTDADAVLLIGDRAMARTEVRSRFWDVWDLGDQWYRWTGLPFVFAMWVARPGVEARRIAAVLTAARDVGLGHLEEIAAREAPLVEIPRALALRYLRENLHFTLGTEEIAGLRRFYQLCVQHELAPPGSDQALGDCVANGCAAK